jgi:hypothetical protein
MIATGSFIVFHKGRSGDVSNVANIERKAKAGIHTQNKA